MKTHVILGTGYWATWDKVQEWLVKHPDWELDDMDIVHHWWSISNNCWRAVLVRK